MVAPTAGPRTTASRMVNLPGDRRKSTRMREKSTPAACIPGAPATTRSSAASPRMAKSRILRRPSSGVCWSGAGGAIAGAPAHVTRQHGVDAVLGAHAEALDLAVPARELEIQGAQRLAVEADDRADLHVEVEVGDAAARLRVGRSAH